MVATESCLLGGGSWVPNCSWVESVFPQLLRLMLGWKPHPEDAQHMERVGAAEHLIARATSQGGSAQLGVTDTAAAAA